MKELKALLVLAEEHSVVLPSLLESLNGLGSNSLYILLRSLELLVLLQGQLPLSSKVVPQNLDLSLTMLASSMAEMRSFFNLEFSASKASTLDTTNATFAL